jgi:hypothetical protein
LGQNVTTESKYPRVARLRLQPGAPLDIAATTDTSIVTTPEMAVHSRRVGETLRAYLAAVQTLLEGKYKHLQGFAPPHMTSACRPLAFIFPQGILVRYDRIPNPELQVVIGTLASPLVKDDGTTVDLFSLSDAAPVLSEDFLHCATDPRKYDVGNRGLTLTLSAASSVANEARDIAQHRLLAISPLPAREPDLPNSSYLRPIPCISVINDFEILLTCELNNNPQQPKRTVLFRTPIRLPVGWEAIDIFPPYHPDVWDAHSAPVWAECDLLAAVLKKNLREMHFRSIDPNAEARKTMIRLLHEYDSLLIGKEESLHQFIKAHPALLCPTYFKVWSKLSLGKRDTDFVFCEASGDYLLVEIEQPSHQLFRNDGQQREELTHAIDQIIDWRRYIEDNLRTVQNEHGLAGISANPSCLVVIGRSRRHCERKSSCGEYSRSVAGDRGRNRSLCTSSTSSTVIVKLTARTTDLASRTRA